MQVRLNILYDPFLIISNTLMFSKCHLSLHVQKEFSEETNISLVFFKLHLAPDFITL